MTGTRTSDAKVASPMPYTTKPPLIDWCDSKLMCVHLNYTSTAIYAELYTAIYAIDIRSVNCQPTEKYTII